MAEVRRIPSDDPDALALVDAMVAEIARLYAPLDLDATPSATPAELRPPGGAFLGLYEDGRAVAGGGVKRLDARTGEIARMYVVPDRRGAGLGRRLLAALEQAARELGYARLRLDTGPGQPAALALYAAAGYRRIPDYNANPYATFWGEKTL